MSATTLLTDCGLAEATAVASASTTMSINIVNPFRSSFFMFPPCLLGIGRSYLDRKLCSKPVNPAGFLLTGSSSTRFQIFGSCFSPLPFVCRGFPVRDQQALLCARCRKHRAIYAFVLERLLSRLAGKKLKVYPFR